jgi:ubiquinone/menaquinone biosynthesis C-methylase UbiE
MGGVDVYRITPELDDNTLDVLVTRLEARGKHPRFIQMMNEYLDAMDINIKRAVLDLGCGTGVAARAIAQRPGFKGRVLGIDISPYLIAAAERLAAKEGSGHSVEFRTGDSHSLSLADEEFDAVVAHTLVSHVDDPCGVLKETARILRPGGLVGIFDGDYASMTFASDDPEKGKKDDEAIISTIVTNSRVMRQMPELLNQAGLNLTAAFSHVVADLGKVDFWAPAIESFIRLLPKSGAMTEEDTRAWANSMFKRSDRGTFFGACNFYSYVAKRP